MDSERQPLLSDNANGRTEANGATRPPARRWSLLPGRRQSVSKPGPLELDRKHRWTILAGIWMANFLSALNTTLVATLLSSISSEFQQANQASWLGTSYLLATCTFTPLYGRLCNVMGRRGANQTAVFFAGIGVLACGLSRTMPTLILARFLSGMGGGGIFTTSSIITSDMFSMRDRGMAQGFASVFNGLGMGLGGPLGGLISDTLGWRWAFLLQTPIFVISFLLTSTSLTYATPGRGKSTRDILRRIDYPGFISLFFAVGSLLVFMSYKFNEDRPWSYPGVIASLIISGLSTIIFVLVELFYSNEPIMAPFLLVQKDPILISISNFLVATCNFSITYFFPMWFETVKLDTAGTAGLHLMPNSVSLSAGSLFAGWVMSRTGRFKTLMNICGIFPFAAGILIAQMSEDSGFFALWLSIIPLGFGNAVVLQTGLIALLTAIPSSAIAVGTGFGQLFRGIGQVFGVALASSIFQSLLDSELHSRLPNGPGKQELIERVRQSTKVVGTLPPDLQRPVRDAYAISLRAVFITAACCTLAAYITRLFITGRSLDQEEEIDQPQPLPPPQTDVAITQTAGIVIEPSASLSHGPVHIRRNRRLSTFEPSDVNAGQDPELEGQAPARSFSVSSSHARPFSVA